MSTYGEIINRVSNTIRTLTKDDRIPKRHILEIFQGKLEFLLSQKLKDMSLHREDGLYTTLKCIELQNIDTYECDIVEFKSCNSVAKGIKKLPKIINSRFGPAIKSVTNIDDTIDYQKTTPSKYRNDNKREEPITKQQYYIEDGYPYLPNSTTELINIRVLTLENYLVNEVSGCSKGNCKSYWDYEVPTSDKLTEVAIQETIKELSFTKQIPVDENPNLDNNIKSKTIV